MFTGLGQDFTAIQISTAPIDPLITQYNQIAASLRSYGVASVDIDTYDLIEIAGVNYVEFVYAGGNSSTNRMLIGDFSDLLDSLAENLDMVENNTPAQMSELAAAGVPSPATAPALPSGYVPNQASDVTAQVAALEATASPAAGPSPAPGTPANPVPAVTYYDAAGNLWNDSSTGNAYWQTSQGQWQMGSADGSVINISSPPWLPVKTPPVVPSPRPVLPVYGNYSVGQTVSPGYASVASSEPVTYYDAAGNLWNDSSTGNAYWETPQGQWQMGTADGTVTNISAPPWNASSDLVPVALGVGALLLLKVFL